MRGSLDSPIWIPPTVKTYVERNILLPFEKPDFFHPELKPIIRCHAVFGREGVGKAHALKHMTGEGSTIVRVSFGFTNDAVEMVRERVSTYDARIVILENAHLLCFEPDNGDTMRWCMQLKQYAENNGLIIVGLFDRLPDTRAAPDGSMATYQRIFWSQWTSHVYFPCPDDKFRLQYWRHTFAEAENDFLCFIKQEAKVTLSLKDDDYAELTNNSIGATILDMDVWRQRVFKDVFVPRDQPLVVDMVFLDAYFYNPYGYQHITQKECSKIELTFRAVGATIDTPTVEKSKKIQPPLATFTEQGATMEGAKEELERRKKRKGEGAGDV